MFLRNYKRLITDEVRFINSKLYFMYLQKAAFISVEQQAIFNTLRAEHSRAMVLNWTAVHREQKISSTCAGPTAPLLNSKTRFKITVFLIYPA